MIFAEELSTWALLVELLLGGLVVVIAGSKLAGAADQIAKRFGLASGWVGLIMLATVTSLPEVVSGGTAVWVGNMDLAFAGIFGSCAFNVTIIVLLNALVGGGSVLKKAGPTHTLTSSFGVILITIALMGILLVQKFEDSVPIMQTIEVACAVLIVVFYLGSMHLTYRFERTHAENKSTEKQAGEKICASAFVRPGLISLVLVAAAWWLAQTCNVLSAHPIELIGGPLGGTVVGVLFLALATSLPEISAAFAAVKLGNLDLALGNIFGSNMFNIFVIPMLKVVSLAGGEPLLMSGDTFNASQNLIAGLLPIFLTAIAVGGLTYRSQRKMLRRFGFDSILIAVVYLGGMFLLLVGAGR